MTPFRKGTELEFLNNLWGLGTEKEYAWLSYSIKVKRGSKVLKANRTFFADRTAHSQGQFKRMRLTVYIYVLYIAFYVSKLKRMVSRLAEAKA